jgi:hypothetical protein
MRFVLQRDVRRFQTQLLARLLEDGCNLNPNLARKMFYEHFECLLASELPQKNRIGRFERLTPKAPDLSHDQFHKTVRYFIHHLPDAEKKITAAVLDVIDVLKQEWQQTAEDCLPGAGPWTDNLQNLIYQISQENPNGHLARHGIDTIGRRLKIAMLTSLLRHVREPDYLRAKYGTISQILRNLGRDPELFSDIMSSIERQVPYTRPVITRTFWRALTNMDAER